MAAETVTYRAPKPKLTMRVQTRLLWITCFVAAACGGAIAADPPADDWADHPGAWAHADDAEHEPRAEFSLGIGYSRIEFDGSPALIDNRDCIHFEPVLSYVPLADVPQLRIGAALGWSAAVDDTRGAIVSNDGGLVAATTSDVSFMMFEPELRLSWRQPLDRDGNYFIEPGVGAGAAIGWLDVAGSAVAPATDNNASFSDTDTSFEWKVFVRAGLRMTTGFAGIEASYMSAGRLEFADDIHGEPSEFYVGIFGAIQF